MTTTNIDTAKTSAIKIPKPSPQPRHVTVSHGDAHDGRLPVTVTVVPVEDLDAKGGVFIDFRKSTKLSPVEATVAVGERADETADARPVSSLKQGDNAIAAMAAAELAAAPAKEESIGEGDVTKMMPAMSDDSAPKHKEPITSHQIAAGRKLTVGQAETFRAEVAVPVAAEGESWLVRGRFAVPGGKDLSSAWLRI